MGHKITIAGSGRHVLVEVTGSLDSTIANKCSTELLHVIEDSGVRAILFDVCDATNVESALQNFTFARSERRQSTIGHASRSAILARPGDTSHDLVEAFVQQAGYNVRLFRIREDAVHWLEEEP